MSEEHSVDFLQKKYEVQNERTVRTKLRRTTKLVGGFLGIAAIVGVFFSYRIAQITHGDEGSIGALSVFSNVASSFSRLVSSGDKPLVGEESDRINFLLLGIGGEGHDGPQLTDTIILSSFKPSTNQMAMLSIPRDLYVEIPGYGSSKINHANHAGEREGDGKGLEVAEKVVEDVTGEDVHYTVRIDFRGFAKLIDELGGINVCVERAFSDSSYPLDDGLGSVETISFQEGCQWMNGVTALKFARSRKGTNGEGSDFARAARQQKIILAAKDRALSARILLDPTRITGILNTLDDHIDTNMSFWEILKLAKYTPDINPNSMSLQVLDTSNPALYDYTSATAGYIIVPTADDWSDIHDIADNMFTTTTGTQNAVPAELPNVPTATVEIQNGTNISGLAYTTVQRLEGSSFKVVTLGNAATKGRARTVIYDLTDGRKSAELSALKEFLGADVVMSAESWVFSEDVVPAELTPADTTPGKDLVTTQGQVDFLIIVGEDAASLVLR